MTKERLEIGEPVHLSQLSRRHFLKFLGASGAGVIGLQQAITEVYGKEPEGTPIVHTYDTKGNPNRVRIIPEERYRRIMALKNFPDQFLQREGINGVGIKPLSNDATDLAIEVFVEEDHEDEISQIRQAAKAKVTNIPIEMTTEQTKTGDDCSSRNNQYTYMQGGIKVNGDSSTSAGGTLTLACYNSDGDEVLVGSGHVMDGASEMYQPAGSSRTVGSFHQWSPKDTGEDVASYILESGISAFSRSIISVPNATGTWDFFGLADEIYNNGPVGCTVSGAGSCTANNEAVGTRRGGLRVYHQVNMGSRNATGGDSGGPWMDNNGNLVAVHSGWVDPWLGSIYDVGSAGHQALSAVDAQLYP
ncbi:twin-arginine translocation signal domain-containing protein [Haladaptatus sp. ZSTT2]|uniref:twin-arginine translocation signal domain-containing protein n=1 Tax=Haladaptatus sp. ZSTT2 TaxID=3120515 RepID=UPI00300E8480